MSSEGEIRTIMEELARSARIRGAILVTREGFLRMSVGKVEDSIAPIVASLSSMSSQVLQGLVERGLDYVITRSKSVIVISVPVGTRMSLAVFIDRDAAELEGLEDLVSRVKAASVRLAAIDEAMSYEEKGLLYMIKREMPEAFMAAILTVEGMPLDVYPSIDYVTSTGILSAVSLVCDKITGEGSEYSVISNGEALVILHKISQGRILAVGINKEKKVGEYVLKIKRIIEETEGGT